jgi:hypothetical protein
MQIQRANGGNKKFLFYQICQLQKFSKICAAL